MRNTFQILTLLFTLAFGFTACNEDPYLPKYENDDLTDTTGATWALDLFLSGSLDGNDFVWQNNRDGLVNFCSETRNGYCDSLIWLAPGDRSFINVETMNFMHVNQTENSFYIDKIDCMLYDSNWDFRADSMFTVGDYEYLDIEDSIGGIQVRYIDPDGKLWNSSLGDNTSSTSYFRISALVQNAADTNSRYIAFGKFSCRLFDEDGFYLDLDDAEFKTRLGVRYN